MNTRPRVLLFSATTIFGGGEVYYIKLAKILKSRFDLAAVVFNPRLHSELVNIDIPVSLGELQPESSTLKRYALIAKALFRALRDFKPNLVHLNGGSETFLDVIPRICDIPILITHHTHTSASVALHKRIMHALCFRLAGKVICVSATLQANLREILWTNNTIVIPNWIDGVKEEHRRAARNDPRRFSLLYVGRIEREKGIFELIESLNYLDGVHLDVVGDGSCMEMAKRASRNLPVTFHGFQEDVSSFYRNADLFVLPSHSEGHPIVLIEAMSWGVPCLTSDIPALIEAIGNGQFAMTCRCGDHFDLAEKILWLQQNQSHLRSLSADSQSYVWDFYSKERIQPLYFDIVSSLSQSKHSNPAIHGLVDGETKENRL